MNIPTNTNSSSNFDWSAIGCFTSFSVAFLTGRSSCWILFLHSTEYCLLSISTVFSGRTIFFGGGEDTSLCGDSGDEQGLFDLPLMSFGLAHFDGEGASLGSSGLNCLIKGFSSVGLLGSGVLTLAWIFNSSGSLK